MARDCKLLNIVHALMRVMLVSERTSPDHQHVVRFNALDFHTLGLVRTQPGIRAAAVADALGIVPTTASSVIARLVKNGLISRTQSANDRRAYDLTLTDQGQVIAQAIHTQDLKNMRLFLSALDEDEQDQMLSLLGRVAARVAELEAPPASG